MITDLATAAWLRTIEQGACVDSGWSTRVRARLEHNNAELGDSWQERSIDDLLREAREECEDVGGWGSLARRAITDAHTDELTRNQLLYHVDLAAEYAARADAILTDAIALAGP